MKIMQLRYFVEVCKYQNVTRAAKEMFVSQPSVTSAIQELEKEFGVNLFYRQSKRMIVTKEGEYLFEQAKDILTRVDETTRAMKNFGGINNSIKIGIPPMIGSFLFPQFFHDFSRTNPSIQFEIQEFGTLQTRRMIEEDRLDAAFVILDEIQDEAFHILPILDTSLVFSCSKESPLAGKECVTVEDLKDEPLIDPTTIGLKGSPTNILVSFTPPQKGAGVMLEGAGEETCAKLANTLVDKHII